MVKERLPLPVSWWPSRSRSIPAPALALIGLVVCGATPLPAGPTNPPPAAGITLSDTVTSVNYNFDKGVLFPIGPGTWVRILEVQLTRVDGRLTRQPLVAIGKQRLRLPIRLELFAVLTVVVILIGLAWAFDFARNVQRRQRDSPCYSASNPAHCSPMSNQCSPVVAPRSPAQPPTNRN